ncbi:hypothetical protein RclHR1_05430001 [Rhizophagus clarus]|uniref:Protein kinase domain-containing protein n=1 Tax=Rhizophagus clarus TaxID=94130 RepID=A0A2Z6QHP3_9GLOM|nr:hypothetical protein RclHR1_10920009 [Rhizophagus clarus]GBC03971.1 hypothetical protein RclHR1_05430001 [Rhizophagus clarus]
MHEFSQQTILADETLNEEEKLRAITILIEYDCVKIIYNVGPKRNCEICYLECLATSYCEHCIRNYLNSKFQIGHPKMEIYYIQYNDYWYISDLGFCGPVNKPLGTVYGKLPYIAPEVIIGKEYSYASDIYNIGMLMWKISSGQFPFADLDYDYYLAMSIINGMRPKILSEIPFEYKELMKQCWNAYPKERPSIKVLMNKIDLIYKSYYHNEIGNNNDATKVFFNNIFKSDSESNKLLTSQVYEFKNLPELRNATEEEQKEFHSRYSYNIPDNIDDFNNPDKTIGLYKVLNLNNTNNSNNDIQISCERETAQVKKRNIEIDDDDVRIFIQKNKIN